MTISKYGHGKYGRGKYGRKYTPLRPTPVCRTFTVAMRENTTHAQSCDRKYAALPNVRISTVNTTSRRSNVTYHNRVIILTRC